MSGALNGYNANANVPPGVSGRIATPGMNVPMSASGPTYNLDPSQFDPITGLNSDGQSLAQIQGLANSGLTSGQLSQAATNPPGFYPSTGFENFMDTTGIPLFAAGMAGAAGGALLGGASTGADAGGMGGDAGLFGGASVDPMTGDVIPAGGGAGDFSNVPGLGGGVDQYGNPIAGATGGSGLPGGLSNLAGPAARLLGGSGVASGGSGNPFMDFLTGSGGGPSLPGLAPGLAALQYARNQPGLDTSRLSDTYNAAAANAPLFTNASIAPAQQAQAAGYGDLLQSQANRGIRGSSFGDQDIANYIGDTSRNIGNIGATAAQQALGLQGQLAGNTALLQNQAQQQKNNIYGRAFDMLGRGLNPTGQGQGMQPNSGMRVPLTPGMPSAGGGMLGNLGIGGIANGFGNMLSGVGSGLGNLFGSTGSSIWGGPAYMNPLQNAGMDSINFGGGFDAGF